jgi:uncharacterized integral membrane protein
MKLQMIIILAISLILVLFTFQNPHPVPMHFVGWGTQQFPIIGVVIVSLLAGVILAILWGLSSGSKLKEQFLKLKRKLEKLQSPPVESEEDELSEFRK